MFIPLCIACFQIIFKRHFGKKCLVSLMSQNASINSKYHYKKHQFGNNQGYIVSTVINDNTRLDRCITELLTVGKNRASECKKYGLSLDDIKSNTEKLFNEHKLSNITINQIVNDMNELILPSTYRNQILNHQTTLHVKHQVMKC